MVDPTGITGTSLAIASLLYSTCRTICDIIDTYKKAPKEYQDLAQDLKALQSQLSSLQSFLRGINDSSLSPEQIESLKDLELPLKSCNNACEDFKKKLSSMTSHSTEDHTFLGIDSASILTRAMLHFLERNSIVPKAPLKSPWACPLCQTLDIYFSKKGTNSRQENSCSEPANAQYISRYDCFNYE